MTWQQISDEIERKLIISASPRVGTTDMVGLLNETMDELIEQWFKLLYEKDESAIQLLAPLKQYVPDITVTGGAFYIDNTTFPGGLRFISSMWGLFEICGAVVRREITFLADNDITDIENPLRKPTNDRPRYQIYYDTDADKKKVVIYADDVPSTVNVNYYRHPAVLTSITGSPEVSLEGHYRIVKRAVAKQTGIDLDERERSFQNETTSDLQLQTS